MKNEIDFIIEIAEEWRMEALHFINCLKEIIDSAKDKNSNGDINGDR